MLNYRLVFKSTHQTMSKLTGEAWITVSNDLPKQSMVHHNFFEESGCYTCSCGGAQRDKATHLWESVHNYHNCWATFIFPVNQWQSQCAPCAMGHWIWKRLKQTSGLLSVWFPFLALYTLFAILEYSLSHMGPPKPLLAHLQGLLLPKVSTLVIHFSQNVHYFVIWYHQPTFKYQERSFIVEVCMTLLGELLVTLQGRIACSWVMWRPVNHVGQGEEVIRAERGAGMRERASGTRWSFSLVWTVEIPGRKSAKKEAQQSYRPPQVGLWEKVLKRLLVGSELQSFLQQGNPSNNCKLSMMVSISLSVAL